jgi:hypothetical protein
VVTWSHSLTILSLLGLTVTYPNILVVL